MMNDLHQVTSRRSEKCTMNVSKALSYLESFQTVCNKTPCFADLPLSRNYIMIDSAVIVKRLVQDDRFKWKS